MLPCTSFTRPEFPKNASPFSLLHHSSLVFLKQIVDASSRAASRATDLISAGSGDISRRLSALAGSQSEVNLSAQGALGQLSTFGRAFADAVMVALRAAVASIRGILGISSDDDRGDGLVYVVAVILTGGVAAVVQRIGGGAGVGVAGGDKAGKDRAKGEGERLLQPIGGAKETVAATEGEIHRLLDARWLFFKKPFS